LYPQDVTSKEDEINIVTIQNVMLNQISNDLGFIVRNKRLVLVEAQTI
jgi:hypothetical protein